MANFISNDHSKNEYLHAVDKDFVPVKTANQNIQKIFKLPNRTLDVKIVKVHLPGLTFMEEEEELNLNKMSRTLQRLTKLRKYFRPFEISKNLATQQNHARDEEKQTHFGFETVRESEKEQKVHKVFENVAADYDIMNDAMSLGIHRVWKDYFMCKLSPTDNTKLLDVAGGTGDIAFRFLRYVANESLKDCHVTVCDINANMLEVGKIRSEKLKHNLETIAWKEGNAEKLPFEDNTFNAYTIAFGIRNCTHIDKVLEEAYRVLQPGGRFLCLEFSQLENSYAQWIYDKYSFQVIPVLGQLISGQWKPYQYLVESIRQFPNQEDFKTMIEEAGFREVSYENLTLGVVSIHSAFKL